MAKSPSGVERTEPTPRRHDSTTYTRAAGHRDRLRLLCHNTAIQYAVHSRRVDQAKRLVEHSISEPHVSNDEKIAITPLSTHRIIPAISKLRTLDLLSVEFPSARRRCDALNTTLGSAPDAIQSFARLMLAYKSNPYALLSPNTHDLLYIARR